MNNTICLSPAPRASLPGLAAQVARFYTVQVWRVRQAFVPGFFLLEVEVEKL